MVCIDDRKSIREDGDALAIEATYFEHVGVNDGIMIKGSLHQGTGQWNKRRMFCIIEPVEKIVYALRLAIECSELRGNL